MSSTSTSNSNPCTFVLVPGSFVTPAEYDKLDTLLQQHGHSTSLVALQTANDGTRLPPATMADDTAAIRTAIIDILDTQHRDVVLVLHSYAGIPGASALSALDATTREAGGKQTAVHGVLYIGSFLPEVGESLRDILGNTQGDLVSGEFLQEPFKSGVPGEYLPSVPREMAPYVFNDLADEDEVARYHGYMVRQASDSYGAGATWAGWKDLPGTYLIPEMDVILPVVVQEAMFERARKQGAKLKRVFVSGAGHCVNISRPEVVLKELEALAGL